MKQRILTAIAALVILVPLIIYGGWPFTFGVYLFAAIALYELMRMHSPKWGILYTAVSILFLMLLVYRGELPFDWSHYEVLLIFLVVLLAGTVLAKNRFHFDDAGYLLIATLFIGGAFHALIAARAAGLNYLLFILFLIWATDSGAYFVGKSLGKRKLWPEISPNKTIGGAIGGIVLAMIVGVVFQLIYPFTYSLWAVIGFAFIISVFGQLGDLAASAIKRHYDIKDFGKLFPGHGGVLDRLDSLLFVLILLNLIHFI